MSVTVVDMLVVKGVPPSDAHLISDLAEHAAKEAMQTIVRVTERLPTEAMQALALVVAAQILEDALGQCNRDALAVLRAAAS